MSMTKCAGCGKSIREYPIALHRVSPKGTPFVGKCNECLGRGENTNTQEAAILDALGAKPARGVSVADKKRPVKERLLSAVFDLQSYITHDVNADRCAACPRWDELQGAAVAAVDEIAALRAKLEAAERGRDVALESHRHVEGLLEEAEQRAQLHSAAWRALGHMLGRFPELSTEIIDAARGGERD